MIRINIKWDFISPTLQTVTGIVKLDYVKDVIDPSVTLATFRVTAKPGSIGYRSLDDKGIPTVYLDAVKTQLDAIVRSYKQGVTMDKDLYSWIISSDIDETKEALLKIPEKVDEHNVCHAIKKGDPEE